MSLCLSLFVLWLVRPGFSIIELLFLYFSKLFLPYIGSLDKCHSSSFNALILIFAGSNVNERWKRDSMMNFEFAATMLGFHLLVNMCLTLAIYLLVRLCYRRSSPVHKGTTNGSFKLLRTIEKDEENGRLLDSEDEEM